MANDQEEKQKTDAIITLFDGNQLSFNEAKNYVIGEVAGRGSFAIGDSRTFIWAKTQPQFWPVVDSLHLGGGNLTIALTGLVTLNFLGGVYALLESNKPRLLTLSDREYMQKIKKAHKVYESFFIVPKVGDWFIPNDIDMTWQLLEKSGAILGIDKRHFKDIWRAFRNKLAHIFSPAAFFAVSAESNGVSGFDPALVFGALENAPDPVFTRHNDLGYALSSEMLMRDVKKASDWLINCINDYTPTEANRLIQVVDWLQKQVVKMEK